MLFALHLLALGVGTVMFLGMIILHRRDERCRNCHRPVVRCFQQTHGMFTNRPSGWPSLFIQSQAVQAALGLGYPMCPVWAEGIAGEHEFFIGSPVNDWIISRLRVHPGTRVTRCFHFLIRLSRGLRQVPFFMETLFYIIMPGHASKTVA